MSSELISLLVFINVITFVAYGMDKMKANMRRRRTPEAVLIMLAVIGGALGAWIGMWAFNHKTRHKKFTLGVPLILLIQVALVVWFTLHPL